MKTLEMVLDQKTEKGGASVAEAIAAVNSLTPAERAELLNMLRKLNAHESGKSQLQ